jgi:hypothetical protein
MSAKRSRRRVLVKRITVDEQLADDLIRVLISPLAEGVEQFFDREEDWEREREAWVQPQTYARRLGIPATEKEKWPWEALVEGQVFLSGEFETVGEPAPKHFKVSPGQREFLRIDNLEAVKEGTKWVQSDLLKSGVEDDDAY